MKRRYVDEIVREKYADYALQVIDKLQSLKEDSCLSGDDSGLDNVWEEIKSQVQEGESYYADHKVNLSSIN